MQVAGLPVIYWKQVLKEQFQWLHEFPLANRGSLVLE